MLQTSGTFPAKRAARVPIRFAWYIQVWMTSGFDSRIHRASRITANGFGIVRVMPSVRAGTPINCIRSARSIIGVSETIPFSNRVRSIPAAMRHSIFSAPAGPRVVMMCMTLIMF